MSFVNTKIPQNKPIINIDKKIMSKCVIESRTLWQRPNINKQYEILMPGKIRAIDRIKAAMNSCHKVVILKKYWGKNKIMAGDINPSVVRAIYFGFEKSLILIIFIIEI